jgi:hypothetical protein
MPATNSINIAHTTAMPHVFSAWWQEPPALGHHADPVAAALLLSLPSGYTQLKPVAGQWKISVSATKSADKAVFSPIACDQPALTAACNQPQLTADNMDKLKVELQLKNKTLTTYNNLAPKRLLVRACYTKASAVDRPWRKAADKIDVSLCEKSVLQGRLLCGLSCKAV